ncbi:MAG: hypothetical protein K9N23_11840 [Akkermansiaceae bacterium]|nr:hypothetical protein [Akkermansiaceae bacterium]
MKNTSIFLLPLAASLNAGELVPAQVPASAKWLLHANFDAMRASETGKAVFVRIEADHGAKLRAFKRMFPIHLLNDVHGVTLCGDGKPDHAVVLIHGGFDRPHIEDVMKAADACSEAAYEGMTILTWKDKGGIQHAAFVGRDLLVFSRQDGLLRQEWLTLKTNAPAPADPFFAAAGGKPLIAACAKLAEIGMPADSARILRRAHPANPRPHDPSNREWTLIE